MTKYYVQPDADDTGDSAAPFEIELVEQGEQLLATMDGERMLVDLKKVSEPSLYSLVIDNRSYEVFVDEQDPAGSVLSVLIDGEFHRWQVQDEWVRRLARIQHNSRVPDGEISVKAPMPGVVLAIEVAIGDAVSRGQGLVVLGAMKMENQIKSPRDGLVKSVECESGQIVEQGRVLVVLE
jgi:biotin carboxyl carrier protein